MTSVQDLHVDDVFGDPSLYDHHFALELVEVIDLGLGVHRELTQRFHENVHLNYMEDPLIESHFEFFEWET